MLRLRATNCAIAPVDIYVDAQIFMLLQGLTRCARITVRPVSFRGLSLLFGSRLSSIPFDQSRIKSTLFFLFISIPLPLDDAMQIL